MMRQRNVEIAVGGFMAVGFAALFMLAMHVSNLSMLGTVPGYDISARFQNVGGLKARSPVSMAGVRVGQVTAIDFDKKTFEAIVRMHITARYDTLPKDTSASILTAGLLGEQYIGLDAGGDAMPLKDGDEIRLTQSALVLEQFIGQLLYNKAQEAPQK